MKMRKTLLARANMLALGSALALGMAATVPLSVQAQTSAPAERQTLDRVVAVVNDGVIMRSELDDRVTQVERQSESRGESLPARDQLESQVLERMIVEEIQLQMARDANISIDDTELNQQVRSIAESNNMTLEEFADAVEADGMTLESVRDNVRREMLMRQVQQRQVSSRVNVSESEVDRMIGPQVGQLGGQGANQEAQREEARQAIFQRRANEELETWEQQIRSQAFVDIRL
nr:MULTISPECIES: SurA N-terminal domain-containing protein [unclassified Halomonas]